LAGLQIVRSAADEGTELLPDMGQAWPERAGEQAASREACGECPALTHASCILLGNSLVKSPRPPAASSNPGAMLVS